MPQWSKSPKDVFVDQRIAPRALPTTPPQAKTAAAKRAGGGVRRLRLVVFVGALLLAPLRLLIDIGGATAP